MIRVSCLLYEGFQLLDLAGTTAVFEVAGYCGSAGYRLEMVAAAAGPVRSSSGAMVHATAAADSGGCDTLLLPGGFGAREPANNRTLLPFVRQIAAEGRRVVSISSGALILAEAGLLDARSVTTHWGAAAILAERYPTVKVDGRTLFARHGNLWTSAGSASGLDLALAIVEQDYGASTSLAVATALILPLRRPGGQPQQSILSGEEHGGGRFDEVMAWARSHIGEALTLERLAGRAGLSVRQFTRAFRSATGRSPARFIEELRVERARALVESGARSLDEVARVCGFGSIERMRRAFVRMLNRTPREIRRRARSDA